MSEFGQSEVHKSLPQVDSTYIILTMCLQAACEKISSLTGEEAGEIRKQIIREVTTKFNQVFVEFPSDSES